jgi:putative membrane protein
LHNKQAGIRFDIKQVTQGRVIIPRHHLKTGSAIKFNVMGFILELLFNAFVLLMLSRYMTSVHVRSYGTALGVVLVVGLLNATIGALIRFPLNLVTLFFLSFLVRLLVTAIMIKVADMFFKGFQVDSFRAALIMAVVLALAGALFSMVVN